MNSTRLFLIQTRFFKVTLLYSALCFTLTDAYPQSKNLNFSHYDVSDGLSQNTINCAFHDSRGFMWFGTQDGLNRFDGYEFRIFRHDPDDATSISANWIWSISEDSSGNLWIGTFGGGLCRFDRFSETFITFKNNPNDSSSLSHNTVWDVAQHTDSIFWVATNNGLNKLTFEASEPNAQKTKAKFRYLPHDTTTNNAFKIIHCDSTSVWITGFPGLFRFDISTEKYQHYNLLPGTSNYARLKGIRAQSGYFWLTSPQEGLFRFNPKTGAVKAYRHNQDDPQGSINSNYVLSVTERPNGEIWVGTTTRLTVIFPDESFAQYHFDPLDPRSLNHDYVSTIYEDRDGNIWLGTRSGLNVYSESTQKFQHIKFRPNSTSSISSPNVICFLEDAAGTLWIGTNDGLNRYDPQTGEYQHFRRNAQQPERGPSANYMLYLMEDKQKNIWIGTRNGGLCRWIRKTGEFEHFTDPNFPALQTGVVLCLLEDSQEDIWIGTNATGLYHYNVQTQKYTLIPNNSKNPQDLMNDVSAFSIFEDNDSTIYVGTAVGGVNVIDRETRTVRHLVHDPHDPQSISHNRIISFIETSQGEIWIGTAQGLDRMFRTQNQNGLVNYTFKSYGVKDGLPNEVIYGILEDANGFLWISTNKGIAKIDISDGGFSVRTYDPADGLQGNEFNQNAFYKDSQGRFYFGGSNGYNVFEPLEIKDNTHVPPVYLTHLKILDREIAPSEKKNTVLSETITEAKSITFPWQSNVFSLEFAALDYAKPGKNQYAYKMEGFDEAWISSGTRRFVTYTNLDAGTYTFRVKGSNNDGVWNEQGTSIEIVIEPPPWRTWWAYFLYGIGIFAAFAGFVRYRVQKRENELAALAAIERAKVEERERVRKSSSADFHDEAGHLITKMTLLLELTKRKLGAEHAGSLQEYLAKIEENMKLLSGGMRDFIWGLDPEKDTLLATLSRLKDFGNALFDHSPIAFQTESNIEKDRPLSIYQRRAIIAIFKEAMNNCLKYSQAKTAQLQISHKENTLILVLSDDGIGFDVAKAKSGYGLKNMAARAEKIGGTFTIASCDGKGSSVRLEMMV